MDYTGWRGAYQTVPQKIHSCISYMFQIQWCCCSYDLQVELIRGCWCELFVLGLAQCSEQVRLSELMLAVADSLQVTVNISSCLMPIHYP